MNAHSGDVYGDTSDKGRQDAPLVSETFWGYVIRPSERKLRRAAMIEIVATFVGVLVLLVAYGQWLMPGADFSFDLLPLKLGITVVLTLVGFASLWVGRAGMVRELQVDNSKCEVRLVQRNRRGNGRMLMQKPFSAIASIVLQRSKAPLASTLLSLRTARTGSLVDVVTSDEKNLLPIRDRLIADMSRTRRKKAVRSIHVDTGEMRAAG